MEMLAFFPWPRLDAEVQVDRYILVPFVRGRKPGGEQQPILDLILKPYLQGANAPTERATLLQLSGHEITQELSDEECDRLFWFAERVAFAGLAKREYYKDLEYWNRDNFTLVLQRFTTPATGVSISSRRRDGRSTNSKSWNEYRVDRPDHVPIIGSHDLDRGLLEALLNLEANLVQPHIADAIFFFNHGNTDSDQVSRQAEVVMLMSAFERALNCGRVDENEIAAAFAREWRGNKTFDASACSRIPAEMRGQRSVSEIWIRDMFRCRNAYSHGKTIPGHPWIWSPEEHLLLGAFAFPLLVKCLLSREEFYRLTDRDNDDLETFEELACARFLEQTDLDGQPVWPWQHIRSERLWKNAARRATDWRVGEGAKRNSDELMGSTIPQVVKDRSAVSR